MRKPIIVIDQYYGIDKMVEAIGNLTDYHVAWTFNRKNNGIYDAPLIEQMEDFRKICESKGFLVLGGTFVGGDGRAAFTALKDFLEQGRKIDYILAPSLQTLSRNVDEALEAIELMNCNGVIFEPIFDRNLIDQNANMLMIKKMKDEVRAALDDIAEEERTGLEDSNNSESPQLSM